MVGHYIQDGYLYVTRWNEVPYNYIIATVEKDGKREKIDPAIIAYDYFYQNRPIVHEVYKKLGTIYRGISKDHDREEGQTYRWKKDAIKEMIIQDLLGTGMMDSLNAEDDVSIIRYLQEFVTRNASALQKE